MVECTDSLALLLCMRCKARLAYAQTEYKPNQDKGRHECKHIIQSLHLFRTIGIFPTFLLSHQPKKHLQ